MEPAVKHCTTKQCIFKLASTINIKGNSWHLQRACRVAQKNKQLLTTVYICSNIRTPLLHQSRESVNDYAIYFRTLSPDSGWNTVGLTDIFLKGLSEWIQSLLIPLDLPSDLDSLITLAVALRLPLSLHSTNLPPFRPVSETATYCTKLQQRQPVGMQIQLHTIPPEELM